MRRLLLAVPFLIACAGAETPPADSAAMAAAPAMLTDADIAGTWTGTATPEGSDSVIANWTQICGAGTCRFTMTENLKDTIPSTYVLAADSVTGTSSPYPDPSAGGAMIFDVWVARIAGNQITGTGVAKLSEKPDSVVQRFRFTGTKAP